ncbi:alginate lyase family protein [candidate division CSSED10-310 bacterium]|uniref:Alginate lyase family protein n=1 Tax=candidate division CSSED10-310 bacterium TaxID=2855610 RepID=A0ABV6YWG1_UNCC1
MLQFQWKFLPLFLIWIFFTGCSQEEDTISLSGDWYFEMTVSFGSPGTAVASITIEVPYPVSIQGFASYEGPNGVDDYCQAQGLISGWIEDETFIFYFVDQDSSDFTIQFSGSRTDQGHLTGVFNAFLREKTWFHGVFRASPRRENTQLRHREATHKTTPSPPGSEGLILPSPWDSRTGPQGSFSNQNQDLNDTHVIFEDFEDTSDCSGLHRSDFSYEGTYSGLWANPPSGGFSFDMQQHVNIWSPYNRLDFWLWIQTESSPSGLSIRLQITGQKNAANWTAVHDVFLNSGPRWQRNVIYFSDFEPPLPVAENWTVTDFSIALLPGGQSSCQIYCDQMRLSDERWFIPILLENGVLLASASNVAVLLEQWEQAQYGALVRSLNEYFRQDRLFPRYDQRYSSFTVEKNNCYSEYRYPFPPNSCHWAGTSFRGQDDNYNIDWLIWENYGREQVTNEQTRYLFWQWNDRFNRHYILSQLAAGITHQGTMDSDGLPVTEADRRRWQEIFHELLADWLYDFPEVKDDVQWGEPAFTVGGDITTAIRTEQWFKMLFLLTDDYISLPAWQYFDCLKILYRQGLLSATNILSNWKPHNSTALQAFSLYGTGFLYPEFNAAGPEWRQIAIEAVRGMSFPDGANLEASTNYHILSLNFINHFFELNDYNELTAMDGWATELQPILEERIRMHLYLWGIARLVPQSPLTASQAIPQRYYVPAINDGLGSGIEVTANIEWLLAKQDQIEFPDTASLYFPDVGQMVIRSGREEADIYLLFDCGPFGSGAHGHQDKLSFVLAAYGRNLICDPGGWGGSNQDWDRSAMHNTITVDDYGQIRPYLDSYTTNDNDNVWHSESEMDIAGGVYNQGYGMIIQGQTIPVLNITHQRWLEFHKNTPEPYFILTDITEAYDRKPHTFKVYFHFHPQEAALKEDLKVDNQGLQTKAGNITIEALSQNGQWFTENRLITNGYQYGNVQSAATAYYEVTSITPTTTIVFQVMPHRL